MVPAHYKTRLWWSHAIKHNFDDQNNRGKTSSLVVTRKVFLPLVRQLLDPVNCFWLMESVESKLSYNRTVCVDQITWKRLMRKYMTKVGVAKIIDSSMQHDSLYYDSVSMQKKPPETNVIKKKLSSFFLLHLFRCCRALQNTPFCLQGHCAEDRLYLI